MKNHENPKKSPPEERDNGDMKKLVNDNLGLVEIIARKYQSSRLPLSDLIQEGSIGLMRGIRKYDPEKGDFLTYVSHWIEYGIGSYVSNQSRTSRIPVYVQRNIRRIGKKYGNDIYKIAQELLKIHPKSFSNARHAYEIVNQYYCRTLSIDESSDGETPLVNIIPGEDNTEKDVIKKINLEQLLEYMSGILNGEEFNILKEKLGIGCPKKTFDEIALFSEYSRRKIQNIFEKAKGKLKADKEFKSILTID